MSVIYPATFKKKAEDETASAVRCATERARRDFNSEEHERLLKNTYDSELERLRRSHGATKETSVSPQLKTGTPELLAHKAPARLLAMTAAVKAEEFTVRKSPVAPAHKLSVIEQRTINAWRSNSDARRDFKTWEEFHGYCLSAEKYETEFRKRGVKVGVANYEWV